MTRRFVRVATLAVGGLLVALSFVAFSDPGATRVYEAMRDVSLSA